MSRGKRFRVDRVKGLVETALRLQSGDKERAAKWLEANLDAGIRLRDEGVKFTDSNETDHRHAVAILKSWGKLGEPVKSQGGLFDP